MKIAADAVVDSNAVAALLVQCAETYILPRFQAVTASTKPDGSLVTSADIDSQNFLQATLQRRYPAIPLLGEEMSAAEQQQLLDASQALWVLDPLDGTSNFAAGVPIFGISLALLDTQGVAMAWIYDPIRRELFTAQRGQGAYANGERLLPRQAPNLAQAVGVVDYKRLKFPLQDRLLREKPFHSQRNFGSCVLEWSWLAAGRYHFYLHGAQQLWDRAAGVLILEEAGGLATQFDAQPLPCQTLTRVSTLASLDPRLHQDWQRWLALGATTDAASN